MDLTKLIMTGKLEKKVTIGDYEVHLETPDAGAGQEVGSDNLSLVALMTVKIINNAETDPEKKVAEYRTSETKKALIEKLKTAQGGLVSWLVDRCNEMAGEQQQSIEGISKK